MYTFFKAFTEYFRLSNPDFATSNPQVVQVFATAAPMLASRSYYYVMKPVPCTFFVAVIGPIRTGKTSFLREYFRLFRGTGITEIPVGSPESVLENISQIRHGYIWYDEIGDLMKKMESYMGPLLPLLNKAYYLDTLSHTRTKGRGVVVEAESYYLHAYFSGTQHDWSLLEKKAIGGFVRRVLVMNVNKYIPFFSAKPPSEILIQQIRALYNRINAVLKALRHLSITLYFPGYNELGPVLEKMSMPIEKKSMVEEYFFKVLSGYIVGSLITFDLATPVEELEDPHHIVEMMVKNGERYGIKVQVEGGGYNTIELSIKVPEQDDPSDMTLDEFMPPNYHRIVFNLLVNAVKPMVQVPEESIATIVTKIHEWLEGGNPPIVSKRTFVREILVLRKASEYEPVIQLLQDSGYIRMITVKKAGRNVNYVILDPKARVCGNCLFFRTSKCPRARPYFDPTVDIDGLMANTFPWDEPCDQFKYYYEDLEVGGND